MLYWPARNEDGNQFELETERRVKVFQKMRGNVTSVTVRSESSRIRTFVKWAGACSRKCVRQRQIA